MKTSAQVFAELKAQREEQRRLELAAAEWPKPEQYATPTTDLPRGPAKFAKLCDDWRATAARGPTSAGNKRGWRMADSIVLRGRVGERLFVGLWVEKADRTKKGEKSLGLMFAYAHGVGKVNADQLAWYLTKDSDIPWIRGVPFLSRTTH